MPELLPVYTHRSDGDEILRDGIPITPDEIVEALNALVGLVGVKRYKNHYGKDKIYKDARDVSWFDAYKALGL